MSEVLVQAREALVAAGITGPHKSHTRENAISKIHSILEGGTEDTFGISGLDRYSAGEVLEFLAELTGCPRDITLLEGYDDIDPNKTIDGLMAAARRLLKAASQGEMLVAATGHPTGLLEHHIRIVDAYRRAGGKVLRPREEESLADGRGKHAEVRYVGGVGCLADWGQLRHTHSSQWMERILEAQPWPEIVLGDHGFAGAAIERDIPTVAVMDINDPALAVAWAEGRDLIVVPMDDNRAPRLYEPAWTIFERVLGGEEL